MYILVFVIFRGLVLGFINVLRDLRGEVRGNFPEIGKFRLSDWGVKNAPGGSERILIVFTEGAPPLLDLSLLYFRLVREGR